MTSMDPPERPDDAVLRAVAGAFADAWNQHDAQRVAEVFTEDAVMEDPGAPEAVLRGRSAIRGRSIPDAAIVVQGGKIVAAAGDPGVLRVLAACLPGCPHAPGSPLHASGRRRVREPLAYLGNDGARPSAAGLRCHASARRDRGGGDHRAQREPRVALPTVLRHDTGRPPTRRRPTARQSAGASWGAGTTPLGRAEDAHAPHLTQANRDHGADEPGTRRAAPRADRHTPLQPRPALVVCAKPGGRAQFTEARAFAHRVSGRR